MSAIFGFIGKNGYQVTENDFQKMRISLLHRALDGFGSYNDSESFLGYCHAFSDYGQKTRIQPIDMHGHVLVADVRLDNRKDLIVLLAEPNKPTTDSELLLLAYLKWGEDCMNHLKGDFVFVVMNKSSHAFFAACDHLSASSIYYYDHPDYFVFGSEVKAILCLEQFERKFNQRIIAQIVTSQLSQDTQFCDLFFLTGAHCLMYQNGKKLEKRRYWNMEPSGKYQFKKDQDWADCLKEILFNVIGNRIGQTGTIGIQLSGGLDSSLVAAIASKILKDQNRTLKTFSSVLPDDYIGPGKDERTYVEELGKYLGNLEQHFVSLAPGVGLMKNLDLTIDQSGVMGAPNMAQIIQREIWQKAQEQGVSTMLTGIGGDTTISYPGYEVLFEQLIGLNYKKAFDLFKKKRAAGASLVSIIKNDIIEHTSLVKYYRIQQYTKNMYLKSDLKKSFLDIISNSNTSYKNRFLLRVNQLAYGKLQHSQNNMASYFQLHCMNPFFNKDVIDFFSDLPLEQTVLEGQPRSLIRRTMIGLVPESIINRNDKKQFLPDFTERMFMDDESIKSFFKENQSVVNHLGFNSDEIITFLNKKLLLENANQYFNCLLPLNLTSCYLFYFKNRYL